MYYDWQSDSFADARNFSISKATQKYWMSIDADERLIEIGTPDDSYDFYMGKIINTYPNAGEVSHRSIRLCKNFKGIKYEFARHENVERSVHGMAQGIMPLTVKHIGYDELTPEESKAKTQLLLNRHYKQLSKEPDNEGLKYHIFSCLRDLGNFNEAFKWGYEALFADTIPGLKAQVCIALYTMHKAQGNTHLAIECLYRSLTLCPEQYSAFGLLYAENPEHKNKIFAEIDKFQDSQLPFDISKSKLMEIINNEKS